MPLRRLIRFALLGLVLGLPAIPVGPATAQDGDGEDEMERFFRDFEIRFNRGQEIQVEEILADVSRRIGIPIIVDPNLSRTPIRFLSETRLNYHTLKSVLQVHGIELVTRVPDPDHPDDVVIFALLQRTVPTFASYATRWFDSDDPLPPTDEVVTAVYPVEHADPNGIFAAIRGMMSRDQRRLGNIVHVRGSSALVVTDLASNVRFYGQMIEALDAEGPQIETRPFHLQNALAQEVAAAANEAIQVQQQAQQQQEGGGSRPPARLIADQRTNKIFAIGVAEDLDRIEELVREFDTPVPPLPRQFHVYRCQNADAVDLAAKLMELFAGIPAPTRDRGGDRESGVTTRQAGRQRRTQPTPQRTQTGGAGDGGQDLNPAQQELPTRIVADEQTNSLLIQAEPRDYQTILELLDRLDQKRRRVMIEAQVFEVEVTDDMTLAFELGGFEPPDAADPHMGGGAVSSFGLSTVAVEQNPDDITFVPFGNALAGAGPAGASPPSGLSALLFRDDLGTTPIIINAIANDTDSDILTKPFAIVNDNETATFEVTRAEPFEVQSLAGSGISEGGFDFAEATSLLEITPRISSEDNLSLEIALQIANFAGQPPSQGAPPPTQSRSYNGIVTVPDRNYVVIGGLEQERTSFSTSKIPFLGDIPLLGYLFRETTERSSRTRVYMFIRPVIMAEDRFQTMIQSSLYLREGVLAETDFSATSSLVPDALLDAADEGMEPTVPAQVSQIFGGRMRMPPVLDEEDEGAIRVEPAE